MSTPLLHRRRLMMAAGGGGEYPLPSGWVRTLNIYSSFYSENALTAIAGELQSLNIRCYMDSSYNTQQVWILYGTPISININTWRNGNNRVEIWNNSVVWASIPLNYIPRGMMMTIEITDGVNISVYGEGQDTFIMQVSNPITFDNSGISLFGGIVAGQATPRGQKITYYEIEYTTSGGHFKFIPCRRPYAAGDPPFRGAGYDSINGVQLMATSSSIYYTDL